MANKGNEALTVQALVDLRDAVSDGVEGLVAVLKRDREGAEAHARSARRSLDRASEAIDAALKNYMRGERPKGRGR